MIQFHLSFDVQAHTTRLRDGRVVLATEIEIDLGLDPFRYERMHS